MRGQGLNLHTHIGKKVVATELLPLALFHFDARPAQSSRNVKEPYKRTMHTHLHDPDLEPYSRLTQSVGMQRIGCTVLSHSMSARRVHE